MQVTLTQVEAGHLRDVLTDCLAGLRRELAATDIPARELRHELAERVRLCERLVVELSAGAPQHQ